MKLRKIILEILNNILWWRYQAIGYGGLGKECFPRGKGQISLGKGQISFEKGHFSEGVSL